jgi:hypothetical protein
VAPATLEPVATAGGTAVRSVPDTATADEATAGIGNMLRALVADACAP